MGRENLNMDGKKKTVIGVISDTHGVLSRYAVSALEGVDHILNAGDAENPEILEMLAAIAPTTSVRGNMDYERWANSINKTETLTIDGKSFHILHNINELNIDPVNEGVDVVISGHTHCPEIYEEKGIFFLNPGSASKKRYHHPHSVAIITLAEKSTIEILPIEDP